MTDVILASSPKQYVHHDHVLTTTPIPEGASTTSMTTSAVPTIQDAIDAADELVFIQGVHEHYYTHQRYDHTRLVCLKRVSADTAATSSREALTSMLMATFGHNMTNSDVDDSSMLLLLSSYVLDALMTQDSKQRTQQHTRQHQACDITNMLETAATKVQWYRQQLLADTDAGDGVRNKFGGHGTTLGVAMINVDAMITSMVCEGICGRIVSVDAAMMTLANRLWLYTKTNCLLVSATPVNATTITDETYYEVAIFDMDVWRHLHQPRTRDSIDADIHTTDAHTTDTHPTDSHTTDAHTADIKLKDDAAVQYAVYTPGHSVITSGHVGRLDTLKDVYMLSPQAYQRRRQQLCRADTSLKDIVHYQYPFIIRNPYVDAGYTQPEERTPVDISASIVEHNYGFTITDTCTNALYQYAHKNTLINYTPPMTYALYKWLWHSDVVSDNPDDATEYYRIDTYVKSIYDTNTSQNYLNVVNGDYAFDAVPPYLQAYAVPWQLDVTAFTASKTCACEALYAEPVEEAATLRDMDQFYGQFHTIAQAAASTQWSNWADPLYFKIRPQLDVSSYSLPATWQEDAGPLKTYVIDTATGLAPVGMDIQAELAAGVVHARTLRYSPVTMTEEEDDDEAVDGVGSLWRRSGGAVTRSTHTSSGRTKNTFKGVDVRIDSNNNLDVLSAVFWPRTDKVYGYKAVKTLDGQACLMKVEMSRAARFALDARTGKCRVDRFTPVAMVRLSYDRAQGSGQEQGQGQGHGQGHGQGRIKYHLDKLVTECTNFIVRSHLVYRLFQETVCSDFDGSYTQVCVPGLHFHWSQEETFKWFGPKDLAFNASGPDASDLDASDLGGYDTVATSFRPRDFVDGYSEIYNWFPAVDTDNDHMRQQLLLEEPRLRVEQRSDLPLVVPRLRHDSTDTGVGSAGTNSTTTVIATTTTTTTSTCTTVNMSTWSHDVAVTDTTTSMARRRQTRSDSNVSTSSHPSPKGSGWVSCADPDQNGAMHPSPKGSGWVSCADPDQNSQDDTEMNPLLTSSQAQNSQDSHNNRGSQSSATHTGKSGKVRHTSGCVFM